MRVNTDELERQASELQTIASRIYDIQDSVLRIARNLAREQFGERFRSPLNSAAASIGRRSEELRKMRTALQQISQLYERTEDRIVDEAEHASVHYEQSGIGSISIPGIQDIIVNPAIIVGPGGNPSGLPDLEWFQVPPVVPIGLTSVLRELMEHITSRDRMHRALENVMDAVDDVFQEQYGPVWISEGSARRTQMRSYVEELMETAADGFTPDLDSVSEEIARIAREAMENVHTGIPQGIAGAADAVRDAIQEGVTGRIPSLHEYRTNPPDLGDVAEAIAGGVGAIDWTPWTP